jgi:hypothetical protein
MAFGGKPLSCNQVQSLSRTPPRTGRDLYRVYVKGNKELSIETSFLLGAERGAVSMSEEADYVE